MRDRNYHSSRCENGGESDDDKKAEDFTFTNKSVKGLCGLHNLGNSCYMNSALQCLSHTKELTQYFIEKKYLNDLNSENKLGKKGKLAKKYADLLKKLWCGERHDIHPTGLRNLFANKQVLTIHFLKKINTFNSLVSIHKKILMNSFLFF